jgi:predicted nucleotidyltransferase
MDTSINIPKAQIAKFCQSNHITHLALLGDAVPDTYPEYRIKILVEFDPEHIPGLAFFRMQRELGKMLGHDVDLRTAKAMNPLYKQEALSQAQDIYAV